jgi:UDP-N-acetylglucosamine:LPS N-acetylglucosamine transferase
VKDQDMTGEKLFALVNELWVDDGTLERMSSAAKRFAKPGAAQRAAAILEDVSQPGNIR